MEAAVVAAAVVAKSLQSLEEEMVAVAAVAAQSVTVVKAPVAAMDTRCKRAGVV